jgi:hypothetical protein
VIWINAFEIKYLSHFILTNEFEIKYLSRFILAVPNSREIFSARAKRPHPNLVDWYQILEQSSLPEQKGWIQILWTGTKFSRDLLCPSKKAASKFCGPVPNSRAILFARAKRPHPNLVDRYQILEPNSRAILFARAKRPHPNLVDRYQILEPNSREIFFALAKRLDPNPRVIFFPFARKDRGDLRIQKKLTVGQSLFTVSSGSNRHEQLAMKKKEKRRDTSNGELFPLCTCDW